MSNIRVDVDYTIKDGTEIMFRSPVDCSQVTGLIVYYPGLDGNTVSKVFTLSDAHGNNVGDIDHLFADDVVVKVILEVTKGMAFVQNADTNTYIENTFLKRTGGVFGSQNTAYKTPDSTSQVAIYNGSAAAQGAGIWLYGNDHANGGLFRLQVYDTANSAYRALDGCPNGDLKWNGGNVYHENNKPKISEIGAASNPNLVENWYWKNPVNQRGFDAWSGEGYTIDRWRFSKANDITGGVDVEEDCVRLYNESASTKAGTCALIHVFENPSRFAGKQVTVSVKFKKFTVNTSEQGPRIVFRTSTDSYAARTGYLSSLDLTGKIYTWTTIIPDTVSTYLDLTIGNYSKWGGRGNIDFQIEAVKVEFGAVSTLEYDLLNNDYDYAAELLKCQRFYWKCDNYGAFPGYKSSTAYAFIYLPTVMRVTPTITMLGTTSSSWIYCTGTRQNEVTPGAPLMMGNIVRVTLNETTAVDNAQPITWLSSNGGFELSADL